MKYPNVPQFTTIDTYNRWVAETYESDRVNGTPMLSDGGLGDIEGLGEIQQTGELELTVQAFGITAKMTFSTEDELQKYGDMFLAHQQVIWDMIGRFEVK